MLQELEVVVFCVIVAVLCSVVCGRVCGYWFSCVACVTLGDRKTVVGGGLGGSRGVWPPSLSGKLVKKKDTSVNL